MSLDSKVLSCALRDKKCMSELTDTVNIKYFDRQFSWLYELISSHFLNPRFKEIPSREIILEQLRTKHPEELVKKLISVHDDVAKTQINISDFSYRLNELKVRYNVQVQKDTANNISKNHLSGLVEADRIEKTNKLLREAVVEIESIYKSKIYEEGSLSQTAESRLEQYEFIEQNPDAARGILTGFSDLDIKTNGLHEGELMIVAGATGTGKSIVMHNIGVNAYIGSNNPIDPLSEIKDNGHNVLYFSLEMPKTTIERRIDACLGDLYYNQLRDGKLNEADKQKYITSLRFQKKYNKQFHIVDMPKGATVREIELKYNEVCAQNFKPDMVIVDYMGIMSPNNKSDGQDWLDLGQISAELHEFARVYKVVVITGSQVNRPKDGKNEHSTDRLARSSMISTNANVIIQIDCRDNEHTYDDMPIFITKLRDGEKGQFTLHKNFSKMKIIDTTSATFGGNGIDDDDI